MASCKITIQDAENFITDIEIYNDELELKEALTEDVMQEYGINDNTVFYSTNDGDYKNDTDEEGYETGKLFTLDSKLKDIFACTSDPILVVGYKVKVYIAYDGDENKIAASSGIQLTDLLESVVGDIDVCAFTVDGKENVDIKDVLGNLAGENEVLRVSVSDL